MMMRTVPIVTGMPFAPGRPHLGAGVLAQPSPTPAARETINAALDEAIGALESQMQEVVAEAQLISPEMMQADASSYRGIQKADDLWMPEIRTLVDKDARELATIAASIRKSTALGPYLSRAQGDALTEVENVSVRVSQMVRASGDLAPIDEGAHRKTAEVHLAMHVDDVLGLIKKAERAVVSAEAGVGGAVPILEEYEKNSTTNLVVVLGVVVLAILVVTAVSK